MRSSVRSWSAWRSWTRSSRPTSSRTPTSKGKARSSDDPIELRIAAHHLARILARHQLIELVFEHGGVGDGFRREVVVEVHQNFLVEFPRASRRVGPRLQLFR